MNTQPNLDEMEAAINSAVAEVTQATRSEPVEQHRDLIQRSLSSFAEKLDQINDRIEAIRANVVRSAAIRDVAIAEANAQHRTLLQAAEKDLYQLQAVRTVMQQAHANLTNRPE
jgi:ABC-type transporter Mla subunit MlaD